MCCKVRMPGGCHGKDTRVADTGMQGVVLALAALGRPSHWLKRDRRRGRSLGMPCTPLPEGDTGYMRLSSHMHSERGVVDGAGELQRTTTGLRRERRGRGGGSSRTTRHVASCRKAHLRCVLETRASGTTAGDAAAGKG